MKLPVTHKVKQRQLLLTAMLLYYKKILELTSKKSRLPINNCLAYLLNEYMLDTLNKFETYYNTAQAFLKLMG